MAAKKTSARPPRVSSSGTRITFFGFAAYVGALRSRTSCGWWDRDPEALGWNHELLVATDLSKTPTAAQNGEISVGDIQCDDHRTNGGLTTVGPRYPQGSTVGAIWLSETYWNSLPHRPERPGRDGDAQPYELTSHVYLDGKLKGRRFYGVHARLLEQVDRLSRVEIWHAGRSRVPGEQPFSTYWLDLAQDAHPVGPGGTEIDLQNAEGALFVDEPTAKKIGVYYPKLPVWMGFELL